MVRLPEPVLLLAPGKSRDRNGPLVPTLNGGVNEVDGLHGKAWEVAEATKGYARNPVVAEWSGAMPSSWGDDSTSTIAKLTDPTMPSGYAARVTPNAGVQGYIYNNTQGITVDGHPAEMVGGFLVRGTGQVRLEFRVNYVEGGSATYAPNATHELDGTLQWLPTGIVNPDPARTVNGCVAVVRAMEGNTFDVGGFQYEAKPHLTPLAWGGAPGCSWTGTPHNSPVVRTEGNLRFDIGDDKISRTAGTILIRTTWGNTVTAGQAGDGYGVFFDYFSGSANLFFGKRAGTGQAYSQFNSSGVTIAQTPAPEEHVEYALVWGDGERQMFLNDTASTVASLPDFGSQSMIWLGGYGSYRPFNAKIESVLVFDRELTPEERAWAFGLGEWTWSAVTGQDLIASPVLAYRQRGAMPEPMLLLRPGGSHNRNGPVSPTISGGVAEVKGRYGSAWVVGEATENLFPNPTLDNIATHDPGWDTALNGTTYALDWTVGYNSGVNNPTVGYHAHINPTAGPDGSPCWEMIDRNTQFGEPRRWMGVSASLGTMTSRGWAVGQQITLSFEMKNDTAGKGIMVGLYHRSLATGGNVWGPNPQLGQRYLVPDAVDEWQRVETTFTLTSDVDPNANISVYLYGYFGDTEGTTWFDNPQIEAKGHATPFTIGTRAASAVQAPTINTYEGAAYVRFRTGAMRENQDYFVQGAGLHFGTYGPRQNFIGGYGGAVTANYGPDLDEYTDYVIGIEWRGDEFREFFGTEMGRDFDDTTGEIVNPPTPGAATTINIANSSVEYVESAVFFDRMLTDEERERLVSMPHAWTWEALTGQIGKLVNILKPRGAFGAVAELYRADRYGRLLERVDNRIPVQGRIALNANASVKRSLELEVNDPHELQPLVDFVVPVVTLTASNGWEQSAKMGHFLAVQPRSRLSPARYSGSVAARGIEYLLERDTISGGLLVSAGTDTGAAARQIALGGGFQSAQLHIPDTGVALVEDLYIEPGTSRLSAMTKLLNIAGWYAPWSDGEGIIRTRMWMGDTVSATSFYSTHEGLHRILDTIEEEPDYLRVLNRVTVRNIAPEVEPIFATAQVTNPDHPLHPDKIGLVLAETVDDPDVPDEATALRKAEALLSHGASYYRRLRVTTIADLAADAHEVIDLDVQDDRADIAGAWLRDGWSIEVRGAKALMSHELNQLAAWR